MTAAPSASAASDMEVRFQSEELFFSRTNEAGVILSGNTVFQRVSGYAWDELIDKPHKIIRHPETPRAVFWALWATLKRNLPIGAYVKNRAKDGRYYWVFAIVTPIEAGYLSVRLKPTSDFLSIIKQEYPALSDAERREAMRPEDSARLLIARLAELGFDDYECFMAIALRTEIGLRDRHIGREPDARFKMFDNLVEAGRVLLARANLIADEYAKNEYMPLNFEILAAQLGVDGAAISVVSNNYDTISSELNRSVFKFVASAKQVCKAIYEGLFLICVSRMQRDMLSFFRTESCPDGRASDVEMTYLDRQQRAYTDKAVSGLEAIAGQVDGFRQDCADMKRLAIGLEVTRIMAKVECSRLLSGQDGLNELLNDLEDFQKAITTGLKEIEQSSARISNSTECLLKSSDVKDKRLVSC
jgi:PAS domain S-box-containing protein